jgi:hypothetical protein
MGPPAGLKPVAVQAAKNHRFYDVSPKAYNPAQVRTATAQAAAVQQVAWSCVKLQVLLKAQSMLLEITMQPFTVVLVRL